MSRYTNTVPQIIDKDGIPIVGAKKFFFEPNSTTFRTIFVDSALNIPASNPQVTDANGRYSDEIFLKGVYKEEQQDNSGTATGYDGVTLWTKDPVGEVVAGQFSPWVSATVYNIPDIVLATDDIYYVSLIDNNQGNDPTLSPLEWEPIQLGAGGDVNLSVIRDINSNESMIITATNAAVNHLDIINAAVGNKPQINQIGIDDIGIDIEGVELLNGVVTGDLTGDVTGNVGDNLSGDVTPTGNVISINDNVIGSNNIKNIIVNVVNGVSISANSTIIIAETGFLYIHVDSGASSSLRIELLVNSVWTTIETASSTGERAVNIFSIGTNVRIVESAGTATGLYSIDKIEG